MQEKIQTASSTGLGLDDVMADLERRVATLKDCYTDKQVRARAAKLKAEPTVDVVNAASVVRNAFTILCSF